MSEKLTRREALLGASSALLLQVGCGSTRIDPGTYSPTVFRHGVREWRP